MKTLIAPRLRQLLDPAAATALLAGVLALGLFREFAVDDALISLRYASRIAAGAGHRFNLPGAATDGVTPLPWPYLLAPFSASNLMSSLARARALGCMMHLATVVLLAAAPVLRVPATARTLTRMQRALYLLLFAIAVPNCAYAQSGMETPLAAALVAFAATRTGAGAALAMGFACSLRPELAPFALAFGVLRAASAQHAIACAAATLAPIAAAFAIRMYAFGALAPLSVFAKPADPALGARYALAGVVLTGIGAAWVGTAWVRYRESRALGLALCTHALAIAAVGGDWMAYARMFAPVLPALTALSIHNAIGAPQVDANNAGHALKAWRSYARAAAAIACTLWFYASAKPWTLHVLSDRHALVERARPLLGDCIASVDVGWPAAAKPSARVVDLAGLTDPEFAYLAGGHTSKRIDMQMLLAREVDTILLYGQQAPSGQFSECSFPRRTDAWLADSATAFFAPRAFVALGSHGYGYWILQRRPQAPPFISK